MNQIDEGHPVPTSLQEGNNNYVVLNGNDHQMNNDITNLPTNNSATETSSSTTSTTTSIMFGSNRILYNFILMSILFSCNHGCVVACLSLATARLGSIGAYQSGLLYITYSFSGLIGSTHIVKELGSRNAIMFGMLLYCLYVLAFYIATNVQSIQSIRIIATIGALFGGWGAGFLWTAQGTYFTRASQLYHIHINSNNMSSSTPSTTPSTIEMSTSKFASIFAFIYLSSEVGLRALSTLTVNVLKVSWSNLFAFYAFIAIISTLLMIFVQTLPEDRQHNNVPTIETESESDNTYNNNQIHTLPTTSIWYKATAAWRLLLQDRKMKYMIGLNAIFGFTSSFLTSYVNGTVVRYVLGSDTYVGVLTAWVSCVAAICSVLFGYIATNTVRKGYVLTFGALCFMCVGGLFIIYPNVSNSHQWNWLSLLCIYTLHGIGRSTFEGTLKSTFADYFAYEKEGAFANIILQNGLSSAFGFMLTFTLHCSKRQQENWGHYCIVNNKDGSVHDVLSFELLIVVTAILAIFGYRRASAIRHEEMSRVMYENIPTTII